MQTQEESQEKKRKFFEEEESSQRKKIKHHGSSEVVQNERKKLPADPNDMPGPSHSEGTDRAEFEGGVLKRIEEPLNEILRAWKKIENKNEEKLVSSSDDTEGEPKSNCVEYPCTVTMELNKYKLESGYGYEISEMKISLREPGKNQMKSTSDSEECIKSEDRGDDHEDSDDSVICLDDDTEYSLNSSQHTIKQKKQPAKSESIAAGNGMEQDENKAVFLIKREGNCTCVGCQKRN
ncbi:hypothetical protein AVEN_96524-1 [Araneus ventricosus]|uniref:Uncharacterized protein n=1 Tax=Araneus ventricosus TaxID=182803 RepID=A0A4Y2CW14_ARAVE|nr:hypothetical protein AVEN_96524-1 [Araneus ventricosus]